MNAFDKFHPFDSNPLYALMHESIYMNGDNNSSNWAAERAIKERASDWDPVAPEHGDDGVLFTGEWMKTISCKIFVFVHLVLFAAAASAEDVAVLKPVRKLISPPVAVAVVVAGALLLDPPTFKPAGL